MRVAIFTDNDFDKINGVTTTLKAVLQHAPAGIEPRIYTAADLPVDTDRYLALKSIGMPIPFYSGMRMYLPRLRAYLRCAVNDGIDVIHLTTPGPVGLAALYVASRLNVPMVGSFHTDLEAYARMLSGSTWLASLMREYMRWPYGRCQYVLAPSESTRQLLMRTKTSDDDRVEIWTRGVDTTLFSPARRSWQLRERWGVSDRRLALIYVGRVSREKGLHVVPQLESQLYAAGIGHRFIVVGDGPMLPELKAVCPDAVYTGSLGREAVADAFASADIFVFPSHTDTAGNVVLEAQASGLPVLVSDQGGPRENMIDGGTGFASGATATDLARQVALLTRDHKLRRAMSADARAYALSRRWETALQPLYRAYRKAEASGRARAAVGAGQKGGRYGGWRVAAR